MLADLEDAVALTGRRAEHAVPGLEGAGDPALQGVGAQVALHHEPGVAALVEARDPSLEESVELVLSHTDGRVGANRPEGHLVGNISGECGVDVSEAKRRSIAAHEVESAFVHVDCPDGGMRRGQSHREGDGSPAASEVEKVATGRDGRRVGEKDRGPGIEPIRAEDATGGGHLQLASCQGYTDRAQVLGACRGRSEVVVGPHTVSVPDGAG